jgi:hypothetical protein
MKHSEPIFPVHRAPAVLFDLLQHLSILWRQGLDSVTRSPTNWLHCNDVASINLLLQPISQAVFV